MASIGRLLQPPAQCMSSTAASERRVGALAAQCHPITRGWFFDQFERWCASGLTRPCGRTMVLRGPPGIGKSSLAAALCCHSGGRVLSYHFCESADSNSRDPATILRAIAYRLAGTLRDYRTELLSALADATTSEALLNTVRLGTPSEVFDAVLARPLLRVSPPSNKWAIVVVDGVDVDTSFSSNAFLQVSLGVTSLSLSFAVCNCRVR
jgi:hypothetical protein